MNAAGYRAFVFDLDRTIVTIPIDWISVRKEVERISGERLDRTLMFLQLRQILARRPELRGELFAMIDSYELRAADGTRPTEGAMELLTDLSGRSRLALVTLQGRAIVEELTRTLGLAKFFGSFVTREDSLDRGEQIVTAVRAIGSSPEVSLFIGDMENDIVGARKARVDVAIVGGRPTSSKPDYAFLNMAELRAFLT